MVALLFSSHSLLCTSDMSVLIDPIITCYRQKNVKMSRFARSTQTLEVLGIKNGGRYVAPLSKVQRALGPQVADRVLLNAGQVADFLGLSSPSASKLVRKHGLALSQGLAKAPWGLVRRIRRMGRRRFWVPEG